MRKISWVVSWLVGGGGEVMCAFPREKGWFRLTNSVKEFPDLVGVIVFVICVWPAMLNCALAIWCIAVAPSSRANKSIVISSSYFLLLPSPRETLFVKPGRKDGWVKISRHLGWAIGMKNPSSGREPSFSDI
jgi:hypothetical protein